MRPNRFFMIICLSLLIACNQMQASKKLIYDLSKLGMVANTKANSSPIFAKALQKIQQEAPKNSTIIITLPKGRYDFYQSDASVREYFISNHDQDNPKNVGLPFEDMQNVVFDGQGSELIFHGRMLPVSLIRSSNCTLKNFSVDFETPHIGQIRVLENDSIAGTITFETAPWMKYQIKNGKFFNVGEGWEIKPSWGIAFEGKSKRLVFNTSDIGIGSNNVTELSRGIIKSTKWQNRKLIPGTVIALRGYGRPTPGVFLSQSTNTLLENVVIHYAEGMGLLAQVCENITLDKFSVCLRGDNDPRYFSTQADATHFSGCKGKIISKNGLYEGMMDDAINIHGTYLKVVKRVDSRTLRGRYMHSQSYGFEWGRKGDKVQFVNSKTMELMGKKNKIISIKAIDKPTYHGATEFEIVFAQPLDANINEVEVCGIENLEWTPEVLFANNIIRNNRARGSLFSTPKKTVIEDNLFDHTSGSAILLCGDCNGWFETGACKNVVIRNNKFINALTNQFQFTNAIISIYPEIPDLKNQKKFFHQGIVIENNVFETFDAPLLYAKSVDGLIFRNNQVNRNRDYPAFHWNRSPFLFERVMNAKITNNNIEGGFIYSRDVNNK